MKDKEEGLSLIEKVREIEKREKRKQILFYIVVPISWALIIILSYLILSGLMN